MSNPFGKIVQNDVEYDVSPYQHKIVINTNVSETYGAALNRLYNALREKVSDFNTIMRAELHMKVAGSEGYDRILYLSHIDHANQGSAFSFLGSRNLNQIHGSAVYFLLARMTISSAYGTLSAGSAVAYNDETSSTTNDGEQLILYY